MLFKILHGYFNKSEGSLIKLVDEKHAHMHTNIKGFQIFIKATKCIKINWKNWRISLPIEKRGQNWKLAVRKTQERKKYLRFHNSDMQTFSLEIPPQFLPSHRETESQLPSCCKRQKSLEY